MRIFTNYYLIAIVAFIFGFNMQTYAQRTPEGFKTVSNYTVNFADEDESFYPADWVRLKDEEGGVFYDKSTSYAGDRKGKAIGAMKSQTGRKKGNEDVEYYDYIISPQVKGTVKFWVARYSSSADAHVEVYKMTKTDNGFTCNPKTDLLYSVSDDSWPGYTNSHPSGWIELQFNVGNYCYLGFRISSAYIDEFEASSALLPGADEPISSALANTDKRTPTDNVAKTSNAINQATNSVQNTKASPSEQNSVTPYFTANTLFMTIDPSSHRFSQVTDSVFAINSGGKWEFWYVTGEKLYDAIWESPKSYSSETPQFDGGVVAMRMSKPNAAGTKPICLLYLDGTVKELDPSWTYVSKFEDGLALAKDEKIGSISILPERKCIPTLCSAVL